MRKGPVSSTSPVASVYTVTASLTPSPVPAEPTLASEPVTLICSVISGGLPLRGSPLVMVGRLDAVAGSRTPADAFHFGSAFARAVAGGSQGSAGVSGL